MARAPRLEPPFEDDAADEDLLQQITAGREEALDRLYGRYAATVFRVAAQALDRPAAEEIVQDVFVQVWRRASTFDPARGAVRPWLLGIAHLRVANELRRRSRRPRVQPDPLGIHLASVPDPEPDPSELAWREERRRALRAALAELPRAQRQAVGMAYAQGLSHSEVAGALALPIGTAKTRIRSGLRKLRDNLAPTIGVAGLFVLILVLGERLRTNASTRALDERALRLVVDSEVQPVRMEAARGLPAAVHGTYRGHSGTELAVVTLSNLPPAPAGRTYQAWVQVDGRWISLGTARPDASGNPRLLLIAEDPALAGRPERLEVTLEPEGGSVGPTGPLVMEWSG